MATVVRISENLIQKARLMSKVEKRSLTGQIEHWAQIGQIAEENPDLTYLMIKGNVGWNCQNRVWKDISQSLT